MKLAILADFHKVQGAVHNANRFAARHDCDAIVQCGDFWCYQQPSERPLYWVRGNHEDWGKLGRHKNDQYQLADNLYYVDDWTVEYFNGVPFGFVGGIQKTRWHLDNRKMLGGYKRKTRPDGAIVHDHSKEEDRLWVTEDEEGVARFIQESVDVLITHDQPTDDDGAFLDDVLDVVQPDLHVHGHMHNYRTYEVHDVDVVSLPPADTTMWRDGYTGRHRTDTVGVVYDTDTRDWTLEEEALNELG